MLRKTFLPLLLALCLLAFGASAEGDFHMMDFFNANNLDNLLVNPGDSLLMKSNQYDSEGNQTASYLYYAALDENGELYYVYQDQIFSMIVKDGLQKDYVNATGDVFFSLYVGDTFAQEMENFRASFPIVLSDNYENEDNYITNIEIKDGIRTVTSQYDYAPGDSIPEAASYSYTYSAEADTNILLYDECFYYDAEGNLFLSQISTYTRNVDFTPDERMLAPFENMVNARTVTFVADPGTAQETRQTVTLPRNIGAGSILPEGYELYMDEACTIPFTSAQLDADGNYPAETTIYTKKAE